MLLFLLIVTFFILLTLSSIVARLFAKPIDDILKRIVDDPNQFSLDSLSSLCDLRGGKFWCRPDVQPRELHKPAADHRPARIDSEPLGA